MSFLRIVQNRLVANALILFCSQITTGQSLIRGTVYNRSEGNPLAGVSVLGISGPGTATDSLGHYSIRLDSDDSLYFSWLGKATARFAVKDIPPGQPFDLNLEDMNLRSLPVYSVIGTDYYQDSIRNREEYRRAFGYEGKDGPESTGMNQGGGVGIGLDLDNLLHPGADNRALALQQRLEEDEKDKYIDHRFNRALVKKITGFESQALDDFMRLYRPSFEKLHAFETDYEYYQYISRSAKSFTGDWTREHMTEILSASCFIW